MRRCDVVEFVFSAWDAAPRTASVCIDFGAEQHTNPMKGKLKMKMKTKTKTKTIVTLLLLVSVLFGCLCMPISADESAKRTSVNGSFPDILRKDYAGRYSYDSIAQTLKTINIMIGDGVSFNLSGLPDRQQAGVMVVRMRGEEQAALDAYRTGKLTYPFEDETDEWAKPYIAWLYDKKLMLGIGDNQFGHGICTAQMYVTLMLRALGYVDVATPASPKTDFSYEEAISFAREVRIWDDVLESEPTFTRAQLAAVTHQALGTYVKSGTQRLLTQLVSYGAVDAAAARPILNLYDAADSAYALECSSIPSLNSGLRAKGTVSINRYDTYSQTGGSAGKVEKSAYTGAEYDMAMNFTGGITEFGLSGTVISERDGSKSSNASGLWLKDKMLYAETNGKKTRADLTVASQVSAAEGLVSAFGDLSLMAVGTQIPYYMITEVYVETLDGTGPSGERGKMIVYDTTDFMWQVVVSEMDTSNFGSVSDLTVIVNTEKYINQDGTLTSVYSGMYGAASKYDAASKSQKFIELLSETVVEYSGWGSSVTVAFPDLTQFKR